MTPPLRLSQDTPAVTDLGVQVYLTHAGVGSYVDPDGTPQDAAPIVDGATVEGSWRSVAICTLLKVSVRVDRAGGGISSVDVALEQRRKDDRNPGLWSPEPLQSVRSDGGDPSTATTHTLSASGDESVGLRTTDVLLSGDVRVKVVVHGTPVAGDRVAVAFDVSVTG